MVPLETYLQGIMTLPLRWHPYVLSNREVNTADYSLPVALFFETLLLKRFHSALFASKFLKIPPPPPGAEKDTFHPRRPFLHFDFGPFWAKFNFLPCNSIGRRR
jgi:hypothetical protein